MNKKSYEKMIARQAKELAIMKAKVEQYNNNIDNFVTEIKTKAHAIYELSAIKDERIIKFTDRACKVLVNSKYDTADFE